MLNSLRAHGYGIIVTVIIMIIIQIIRVMIIIIMIVLVKRISIVTAKYILV